MGVAPSVVNTAHVPLPKIWPTFAEPKPTDWPCSAAKVAPNSRFEGTPAAGNHVAVVSAVLLLRTMKPPPTVTVLCTDQLADRVVPLNASTKPEDGGRSTSPPLAPYSVSAVQPSMLPPWKSASDSSVDVMTPLSIALYLNVSTPLTN